MKREVIVAILAIAACCILTACGNKQKNTNNTQIETSEDNINKAISNTNYNLTSSELFSDEKKLVFKPNDVTFSVFYYDQDQIVRYETYIAFETTQLAETAKVEYEASASTDSAVESVRTSENYVILRYKSSEYAGVTASELRTRYGEIEQIKNK